MIHSIKTKKLYQCDMAFSLGIISKLQQQFYVCCFYYIDISINLKYNESALSIVFILCEKEQSLEKYLIEKVDKRYGLSI